MKLGTFQFFCRASWGGKKKASAVISMFLKGLNNCKLDVNQAFLGVGNVVLCQKVVD